MADFEWDVLKARSNARKHGVDFEEAATVFDDPLARIFDDLDHSLDERREIIIGTSRRDRLLVVVFTQRRKIRIVGARRATPRERSDYEQNT
jgi:uncharacterized protein